MTTKPHRLLLERELVQNEEGRQFDVLVLDAFNGDAIPTHLLSTEAFDVYDKHMKSDGVIAVNISNDFVDLRPLIEGLAEVKGYKSLCMGNRAWQIKLLSRYFGQSRVTMNHPNAMRLFVGQH